MSISSDNPPKQRKKPYVAGIAALDFHPDFDWEPEVAQTLYEQAKFPFSVDQIFYEDCCKSNDYLRHPTSIRCPIFHQF